MEVENYIDRIINSDCMDFMSSLPDKCVDLILTDPPYGTTNASWDYLPNWNKLFEGFYRILKPNGAILVFGQIPQCLNMLNAGKETLRHEIIWYKNAATGFLNVNVCPLRIHENIYAFYKKKGAYRPISIESQKGKPYFSFEATNTELYTNCSEKRVKQSDGDRKLQDVIRCNIPSNDERLHPTQKPVELLRYLIMAYSDKGSVVFDPFAGSGSTCVAAILEQRRYIACENNSQYFLAALNRINNTSPPLPFDYEDDKQKQLDI